MYNTVLAVVLLAVGTYAQVAKSPVINCETLQLRENALPNAVTLNSVPFPHHITCVKSVESIRVSVIAGAQANLTDVMLQVHIDGSFSGLFFNFDRSLYATDCNGKALYSRDRMAKKRIDAHWFNIMGFNLATKRTACVVTLVDTMNKAWQSIEVPAVWDEGVQPQALLEPRGNSFSATARSSAVSTTTPPSSSATAESQTNNRVGVQQAEPSKILDISLGIFGRRSSSEPSSAVPFNSQSRGAPRRSSFVGRSGTAGTRGDFNQQTGNGATGSTQRAETTRVSAPTTTTLRTTSASPPTTTTPTTTTTTPTTTTPTTTTTTPTTTTTTIPTTTTTTTTPTTTTTTTPTTTTTTTTPTTTTTTPTTTTTTPTTTTTTTRRPTRPTRVTTTPTTTTRSTTTTVATTTTTQPVNLDMGEITVEGRTYEHHCLNGNLKRVLVPHTGCRSFVTLMNSLPGAFTSCPVTRQSGQTCFDVVTCMCVSCSFNTCPPSFDPQRRFNITIYNPQRQPIGRITGEHIPNNNGGFNENVAMSGIIDPGYLPLRNPDGSLVTTPSPARRSSGTNRRGASRGRGSRPRQSGLNGVISNLLRFF